MWVSHVALICKWVVSCRTHTRRSHIMRTNESCHTCGWVMSHSHVSESCRTHMWVSHVALICEWVMSHSYASESCRTHTRSSPITRTNEPYHTTYQRRLTNPPIWERVMSHSYVCESCCTHMRASHVAFICVWVMLYSYESKSCRIHMCVSHIHTSYQRRLANQKPEAARRSSESSIREQPEESLP